MKTRIIILAVLLFTTQLSFANSTRSILKIFIDSVEFTLPVKEEALIESRESEAAQFNNGELHNETKTEMIDIRPFMKPEKEIEENF